MYFPIYYKSLKHDNLMKLYKNNLSKNNHTLIFCAGLRCFINGCYDRTDIYDVINQFSNDYLVVFNQITLYLKSYFPCDLYIEQIPNSLQKYYFPITTVHEQDIDNNDIILTHIIQIESINKWTWMENIKLYIHEKRKIYIYYHSNINISCYHKYIIYNLKDIHLYNNHIQELFNNNKQLILIVTNKQLFDFFSQVLYIPRISYLMNINDINSINSNSIMLNSSIVSIYTYCLPKFFLRNCNNLELVHMSNIIIEMEENVLSYCKKLKYIKWSNNLTHIHNYCLNKCATLKNIIFPKSLQSIGNYCLNNCYHLSFVDTSNTKSIGICFLINSINLTKIILSNHLTHLNHYFLFNCKLLSNINIPPNIIYIGSNSLIHTNILFSVYSSFYYTYYLNSFIPCLHN